MRPIDADALKAYSYQSGDWSHGAHPMVVEVDDIDDAPTITLDDLRPKAVNLNAEWSSLFKCSACGWEDDDTTTGDTDTSNYCPNCGAKMEVRDGKA